MNFPRKQPVQMVQQVMEEEKGVPVNAVDLCQRSGDEGEALPQLERNQREADQRSQRLPLLTTDNACAPQLRIVVITGLVDRFHMCPCSKSDSRQLKVLHNSQTIAKNKSAVYIHSQSLGGRNAFRLTILSYIDSQLVYFI